MISDSLVGADKNLTSSQAIYFSFVTAATIGYGDISPKDESIQHVIILQIMLSLSFIVMFIANVSGKLGMGALAVSPPNDGEAIPTQDPGD
ncbi:potassium channel family protein [Mucilaginibacter sp. OK098]|uniref:potassium channel family protein n=1 Tax=Mucilaginibacter sp. OK098 TaxID=1855297 RepID=UPI001F1C01A4|nr:potassium channel family protein [Mucilaginibacter sp. OK098]